MQGLLASALLCLILPVALASDAARASHGLWIAEGKWNKDWRMVVALDLQGEELIGRVEKMIHLAGGRMHTTCASCKGELKGKPLKGMVFITGLRAKDQKWTGGQVVVLEPGSLGSGGCTRKFGQARSGHSVDCELEFKDGDVRFRGSVKLVGITLGETVTWKRYPQ